MELVHYQLNSMHNTINTTLTEPSLLFNLCISEYIYLYDRTKRLASMSVAKYKCRTSLALNCNMLSIFSLKEHRRKKPNERMPCTRKRSSISVSIASGAKVRFLFTTVTCHVLTTLIVSSKSNLQLTYDCRVEVVLV